MVRYIYARKDDKELARPDLIPIVVGVTGHRNIAASALVSIRAEAERMLAELAARCPNTPVILLSSLAEGADCICADAALANGMAVGAVLPMKLDSYREDFSGEALKTFERLYAASAFVLEPDYDTEAEPKGSANTWVCAESASRSERYRAAGLYILEHCHALLALWDGVTADAREGGTADLVLTARGASSAGAGGATRSDLTDGLLSGENEAGSAVGKIPVAHLFTPRESAPAPHSAGDAGFPELPIFPELPVFLEIEKFNVNPQSKIHSIMRIEFT